MRSRLHFVLVLLAPFLLHAEVVDRIAVSVGNYAITASDLDREIRVEAFLNGKPPDFSPASKRATGERLVEQQLIRRELETNRYPMPSPEDVTPILDKFVHDHFKSDADFQSALAAAGIGLQDLKDEILWQRALLLFIDARFRLGVQVSDSQIQDYFDKVVKPAAQIAHPGVPILLDDYRQSIEDTLAGPLVDKQLDDWLKDVRQRTTIVYHDEVFE